MMTLVIARSLFRGMLAAALLAAAPFPVLAATQLSEPAQESHEQDVQDELFEQLAERRKAMLDEAQAALEDTHAALQALDEGRSQDALDALARATGKLELLVARDPGLALAPVDVNLVTYDLYAKAEVIRSSRDEARKLLADGRVQAARRILSGLASETVISVTSLPLATYPEAIKAVSPLIDAGRTEEAKRALNLALGTLVVSKQILSLPVIRATSALEAAEALVKGEETAESQKKEASELVAHAREQLEIAELLGYGTAREHEQYREQIAELEALLRGDEETRGVFAKLRKSLDRFQNSFFE